MKTQPRWTFAAALLALATACSSDRRQETPLDVAYIVNTGGVGAVPGITLIDRETHAVIKTITYDAHAGQSLGHFANATSDGKELWLAAPGSVRVLDTAALRRLTAITEAAEPTVVTNSFEVGDGVQSTLSPDGRYLFTGKAAAPKGVNVFDVPSHAHLGTIPNAATSPHVGAVSPDGTRYYTTTAALHTVVGYDLAGLPAAVPGDAEKVFELDLGYGNLHALRVHPNGKYLFVGNATWQIPDGATPRSGINVIDLTQDPPVVIKTISGRPHNFAISPDGRYLASTELKANVLATDCDAGSGDLGNRLQILDISTLSDPTPDPAKIADLYHFETPGLGGSHAGWDPRSGLLYYTVIDNTTTQGWLYVLDTRGLAAATPSVATVGQPVEIGWAPHGVLFPGTNGD
jgi:DNA-binding beta-propeller fold protein YncE